MLDLIIENIIQKIRKEVVQPGMQDIPLTYILTRNIPMSIKHFFDQEVEIWIREEREKFSSNERFDYEMPEVQILIDKIFDTLKQTATFHINQFNRLLERAIKLEANYLIRPQQTLTQFLFRDRAQITTIEVYDTLKYFDKFEYYKDALTDYFNLKYLREISQNQFEELIMAIDQQVYTPSPVETALQTIKTISNFVNEGRTSPSDVIAISMLQIVFADRKLTEFAALIEQEIKDGTEELSMVNLEQILRSGKSLKDIKKGRLEEESLTYEEIADIEKEKPEVQVESIDVTEEAIVPEEDLKVEYEDEYYEEELEEESSIETADLPSPDHVHSAVDELADLVGGKMKGDQLEDLNKLIIPKQRKKFVKRIFNKREQQYQEFIDRVNKTSSWKNASNLIDDFFYQQGLNPYSKEALEFSDLLYNRYFPKDISINKGLEFRN